VIVSTRRGGAATAVDGLRTPGGEIDLSISLGLGDQAAGRAALNNFDRAALTEQLRD